MMDHLQAITIYKLKVNLSREGRKGGWRKGRKCGREKGEDGRNERKRKEQRKKT